MATSLPQQKTTHGCPECGTPLVGKYCHRCGEKLPDPHDLALRHFVQHGLDELTHFDSKIFRTRGFHTVRRTISDFVHRIVKATIVQLSTVVDIRSQPAYGRSRASILPLFSDSLN